jgi:DNA modification methylase
MATECFPVKDVTAEEEIRQRQHVYEFPNGTLYRESWQNVLPGLDDNSLHGCITDPPYYMASIGKEWDVSTDPVESHISWMAGVWRKLRPGAFLVSFSASRTYHWQAIAAEKAGFIVHPFLAWLKSDAQPKGVDLLKQYRRRLVKEWLLPIPDLTERDRGDILSAVVTSDYAGNKGERLPNRVRGTQLLVKLSSQFGNPPDVPESFQQLVGSKYGIQTLKPSMEPILLCQKPYDGGPMDSIATWGTGALNVANTTSINGKYPANCVATGYSLQDAVAAFGEWIRAYYIGDTADDLTYQRWQMLATTSAMEKDTGLEDLPDQPVGATSGRRTGSFDGHVTLRKNVSVAVKPLALLKWLVRLTVPPQGTVLDLFAGSGGLGCAANWEDRKWILIEQDPETSETAARRLQYHTSAQAINL